MPPVRWRADSGFSHELRGAREALDLGVGGFIIFGGTIDGVRNFIRDLVAYAKRPLLIGSDLERGAGQQVEGLTEFPPPGALGALGDLAAIQTAGFTTGSEARSVGINWIFAPVADLDMEPNNPIVQSRSFGYDGGAVARCVGEWVESCQRGGALACVKHYPGHGRTTTDSHAGLPLVSASRDALELDHLPFREAVKRGVSSVMTAHVAYSALDPSGTPATFSGPILQRLRSTGFDGLIVTDAMIMEGAKRGNEGSAAVDILRAGVDILLYPQSVAQVVAGIRDGMAKGLLTQARIDASLRRYDAALFSASQPAAHPPASQAPSHAIADRLLERGMGRGQRPTLRVPLDLTIIDDDVGGPFPPSPGVLIPAALQAAGATVGSGGSRVVLVYAEPRGWKSRAGFSEGASRRLAESAPGADLVVLFGHPRLMETIPGSAPVLVAWHRQRLMQEAAVRWLARE
jgi:beta-N-acetylhexosaminidase